VMGCLKMNFLVSMLVDSANLDLGDSGKFMWLQMGKEKLLLSVNLSRVCPSQPLHNRAVSAFYFKSWTVNLVNGDVDSLVRAPVSFDYLMAMVNGRKDHTLVGG
jgi:hypothetical protein